MVMLDDARMLEEVKNEPYIGEWVDGGVRR